MKTGQHRHLPVDEVVLDKDNPRIKLFLEIYEGEPTVEQIQQALAAGHGDSESQSGPKFNSLKNSIMTHGGIIHPVIVNRLADGSLVCVEGNTRVFLYKLFRDRGAQGNWNSIPAIVYNQLNQEEIEAIRLQAHLIGPRPWDPYSKAKYLSHLRHNEKWSFAQLVEYCGGSQNLVQLSIDAYADMETYYRPLCASDGDFDPTRFTGFVEVIKYKVKHALAESGYAMTDFAKWISDKKIIEKLVHVRKLPQILRNRQATQLLLTRGSEEAIGALEKPDLSEALQAASLEQLCLALSDAINRLTFSRVQELRQGPADETHQALLDAQEALESEIVKTILSQD